MAFLPAGVIDGALTYAEMIRRIAYGLSDGDSVVATPDDLVVSALASPGPAVNVGPGSGVIVSTYPGAAGQAYVIANDATVQVPVPSNTSGAAVTYRVLVAVRDPQYPGMPTPVDPATDLYHDVLVQPTFPTDRPYLHLADIEMANGASTVNPGDITRRAQVATPRTVTDARAHFPGATRNMPSAYGDWPQIGLSVNVPSWAAYALAEVIVNGAAYTGSDTGVGGVRLALGSLVDTQNGIIRSTGASRQTLAVMGRWAVPAGMRGTSQALVLQGSKTSGAGEFTVDYQSQVLTRWTFQERVPQ